ncbi:unnamed protein product, partial [Vitis vinifera]
MTKSSESEKRDSDKSPSLEAFLAPVDLNEVALVRTLATISMELIFAFSDRPWPFQRKNSRSLIRKIEVFLVLLEFLRDCNLSLPSAAVLCFKELYLLLYRSKILLDYCLQSSKLWLLLQNQSISGHFHDLNQEISTLLDVFPMEELELTEDIREQLELLQKQVRRAKLFLDKNDEGLRLRLYSFLDDFGSGRIPDPVELRLFFVDRLGIRDAKSCRAEIEFLEEQIYSHEGDVEPNESEVEMSFGIKKPRKGLITQEIGDTFITVPKDFCCPISLDVMRDPVIISTGQTYDRTSISRWMEEGHCSCPKTGQMLAHPRLVPNRALRNLITQWCTAYGITLDPPDSPDTAREIRLLAKTGKENRAYIAEAGAIPHLLKLLSSPNSVAQENSVTAMLNLSIYDKNKSRIMDEDGIADEGGAVEALAGLLREGTPRGRKDAVTALFNLSTHTDNCARMVASGAVTALVAALGTEGVAEEAAGALALIVRRPIGAEAVGREEMAVAGLLGMMRCGTPRGKENAVAALLELCRSGGTAATERVLKAPALAGLLQTLLFTGTKRARRKAASLARVFQRCENAALHFGGLGVGYAFARNSSANTDASFSSEVSMQMPISVPFHFLLYFVMPNYLTNQNEEFSKNGQVGNSIMWKSCF